MNAKQKGVIGGATLLFCVGVLMPLQLIGWRRGPDINLLFQTNVELQRTYPNIIRSPLDIQISILQNSIGHKDGKLLLPIEINNRSAYELVSYDTCCWNRQMASMPPILCYPTSASFVPVILDEHKFSRTAVMPVYKSGLSSGGTWQTIRAGERRHLQLEMSYSSGGSVFVPPIIKSRRRAPYDLQIIYIFKHKGQVQYAVSPRTRIRVNAPF